MYPNPEHSLPPTPKPEPSSPTATFHLFPLLPPELRNMIWEAALPSPRIHDIYPSPTNTNNNASPTSSLSYAPNQPTEPPPALAAVCREARALALHHYQPLTLSDGVTRYIDPSRDILLLESSLQTRGLLRALGHLARVPLVRDRLVTLALGTSFGARGGIWHPLLQGKGRKGKQQLLQRLAALAALKRIVVVVRQEVQFEVEELPICAREEEEEDGLCRNATLYVRGSIPPGPRSLRSCEGLKQKGKLRSWYRVPWTNEKPGLPYVNEMVYYPSEEEDKDRSTPPLEDVHDDAQRVTMMTKSSESGPTEEDWRVFRKKLGRELEMGLEWGLVERRTGHPSRLSSSSSCGTRRKRAFDGGAVNEEESSESRALKRTKRAAEAMEGFRVPEIQGASLVWRYALPTTCRGSGGGVAS